MLRESTRMVSVWSVTFDLETVHAVRRRRGEPDESFQTLLGEFLL
jgi:hypothetical protein